MKQPSRTSLRDYLWSMEGIKIPFVWLIVIFAAAMLSTYAGIHISLFTGTMVDSQGNVPTRELISYAVTYLMIGVAAMINVIAGSFASEKINLALRRKLWSKIIYTNQKYYDRDGGESLVSRVTTDCDFASRLLTTVVEILSVAVSLGIYVRKMVNLNVKLASIMLVLIPVSVLFGWVYARVSFLLGRASQSALSETTTYLVERTQNLDLIKIENAQPIELRKGLEGFDLQYRMQIRNGLLATAYTAMQWIFNILCILLPFIVGGALVREKVIRAGIVVAFYSIAGTVGTQATNLIDSVGTIRKANGAMSRVIAMLKTPDERAATGAALDGQSRDIRLEKVSFAYGEADVLHQIDCAIPRNQITAVIGTNGSGKSTLFRLLDRLNEPREGVMRYGEADAATYDLHAWRRNICLVAQDSPLLEGTIRENICYGARREISDEALMDVARRARVYDFVQKLPEGFDTRVASGGANFSGGQRQCINIARAMINDPQILLLDEATCSMDAHSEAQVMQAVAELMKGRTTVIIAHSLSTIRNADHVIILHQGRVQGVGKPARILEETGNYLEKVARRRPQKT